MSFPKSPRIELPQLRKAAQGADCMLQLPGVCNHNPETTVLCHRPGNHSMGMKGDDYMAVNACHACHDVLDGRTPSELSYEQRLTIFDEAWPLQVAWWIRSGYLK